VILEQSHSSHLGRGLRRVLAATLVFVIALGVAPAVADRHCYPALDEYFAARQALLDEALACETGLVEAYANLDAAVELAQICGCTPLVTLIQELRDSEAADIACSTIRDRVFHAETAVKDAVHDCHH
jgi:hypothetical protein